MIISANLSIMLSTGRSADSAGLSGGRLPGKHCFVMHSPISCMVDYYWKNGTKSAIGSLYHCYMIVSNGTVDTRMNKFKGLFSLFSILEDNI